VSDNRARAWVQRLLRDDIRSGDLANLFLYARDRPDGRPSVKEIGDFVAHHNERERGIITDATRDWLSIVLFHAPALMNPGRVLFANALPPTIIDYLRVMLDRLDPAELRKHLKIKQKDGYKELKQIIEQLNGNADDTFWFSPRSERQTKIFNYVCSVIAIKPAFDGDRLSRDLLAILRSAGAITHDEMKQTERLSYLFQMFAVSIMHNSRVVAKDQAPILLKAGGASESPGLSVFAAVPAGKNPFGTSVFLSAPIFHTSLIGVHCCEPELLADNDWSGDIEVTSNGRIGFLV